MRPAQQGLPFILYVRVTVMSVCLLFIDYVKCVCVLHAFIHNLHRCKETEFWWSNVTQSYRFNLNEKSFHVDYAASAIS